MFFIDKSSIDTNQYIEGRKVVEDSDDEVVEYCHPVPSYHMVHAPSLTELTERRSLRQNRRQRKGIYCDSSFLFFALPL